jgi:2-amino-4-hydroxy-6-hydroxymethyldihydropteridine diphosphokinase
MPDTPSTRAFIGLGSNLGDRYRNVSEAARLLGSTQGVRMEQLSPVIETESLGGAPQGPYLNSVAAIETTLCPQELLKVSQRIEQELGRVREHPHWGPRTIDLDILLYGQERIDSRNLIVPHPRLHQRRFVLEPLAWLAPDLAHPLIGKTMRQLLDALTEAAR